MGAMGREKQKKHVTACVKTGCSCLGAAVCFFLLIVFCMFILMTRTRAKEGLPWWEIREPPNDTQPEHSIVYYDCIEILKERFDLQHDLFSSTHEHHTNLWVLEETRAHVCVCVPLNISSKEALTSRCGENPLGEAFQTISVWNSYNLHVWSQWMYTPWN